MVAAGENQYVLTTVHLLKCEWTIMWLLVEVRNPSGLTFPESQKVRRDVREFGRVPKTLAHLKRIYCKPVNADWYELDTTERGTLHPQIHSGSSQRATED